MNSIKNKVMDFVKRYAKVTEINEDENIFEMGFINSLFSVQLILFIENEFNISVKNEDLGTNKFNTLNSICNYIQNSMRVVTE